MTGEATEPADISVIIAAFTLDRWEDLVRAVASVRHQTRRAREIIVVADHAPELMARALRELGGVCVVANTRPQGLSGARQTGADVASSSILAFLDDDAVAEPQWIAELELAHRDPAALGAGGEVVPAWVEPRPSWFPSEFNWVVGCHWTGMPNESTFRNPIGANMAIRAEVLRTTGDFAHVLGRSGAGAKVGGGTADETEFCIRASRLHPGRYWIFRPDARVRHTVAPSRGTWSYFVRRCRLEGRSKALLTGLVGSSSGLVSERAYVRSVLPRAIIRELRTALGGDVSAFARAGAIVAGLLITGFEYGRVRVALVRGGHDGPGAP